ncbi:Transferase [Quillaja saponaria]|uniref:Transferase n=1 Tax=Quillaja saponaria TaxID=32244 RepID=A0AAD7PLY4_QUISA|nr:Transferase [Quillaja saponaria]
MCSSVIIKEAAMVTPAEPTPVRVLPLSAIDSQLFLGFTIEYLLVYKPCSGSDQVAITARLKTALSKALVPYYPFAGRVRTKPDGSTGLEVVCRAQGALFIHAVSNCFAMSDFERAPPTVTHWRKLLSFYVADVLIGDPPLVIQLTWLKDGSAAIGVGINHCICDGIGSAEFLNSLAELATERSGFGDIEPKPVWNRHLLNPVAVKSNKNINSTILPEFNRVPDVCGFLNRVSDELIPTSVVFDNRLLNELKRIALSTSPPGEFSYTSFEVLAGHVWRSWARALNFPSNQILKLLFSINIRNRVKPSLPAGVLRKRLRFRMRSNQRERLG